MLTSAQASLLNALANALTEQPVGVLSEDVIKEAEQQSVLSLITNGNYAKSIFANNYRLLWEQQQLEAVLAGVQFTVLKGAAASIYYPEPLRRTLGDIDILVKREDYERAKTILVSNGYQPGAEDERHIHYYKNRLVIELHRRFATLQTIEQERLLDNWLSESPIEVKQIGRFTFPMLPEEQNGLVLLTHINQHLEEGLGLRQILDWIMYVNHSLSDQEWPSFKEKADQLGLTTIAKVVAKLGQMYLGLNSQLTWCSDAADKAVYKLLEYAFECGNFGHKNPNNNTVVMVMSHGRGIVGFFRNLQRQGLENWTELKKQPYLKPVAWVYQLCRYIRLGLEKTRFRDLLQNWRSSRKRNQLMDELGATRVALKR